MITLIGRPLFRVKINYQPNYSMYFNNLYVTRFCKPLVYITMFIDKLERPFLFCWRKLLEKKTRYVITVT